MDSSNGNNNNNSNNTDNNNHNLPDQIQHLLSNVLLSDDLSSENQEEEEEEEEQVEKVVEEELEKQKLRPNNKVTESDDFPFPFEDQGSNAENHKQIQVSHKWNHEFINWGVTIVNRPRIVFVPRTKGGVCRIVKWAKAHGLRVRCSAFRHSWSDIFGENDQCLISFFALHLVEHFPSEPAVLSYSHADSTSSTSSHPFTEINLLSNTATPNHCLCRIGAAVSNEQFRRWSVDPQSSNQLQWALPYTVVMTEISMIGTIVAMCHGAGWRSSGLADLVREVEFVNYQGNIQILRDRELLRCAAGSFGLMGVILTMTIQLDRMKMVHLKPVTIAASEAIPFWAAGVNHDTDCNRQNKNFHERSRVGMARLGKNNHLRPDKGEGDHEAHSFCCGPGPGMEQSRPSILPESLLPCHPVPVLGDSDDASFLETRLLPSIVRASQNPKWKQEFINQQVFESRCQDYYAEWFWFPYQNNIWVHTWNCREVKENEKGEGKQKKEQIRSSTVLDSSRPLVMNQDASFSSSPLDAKSPLPLIKDYPSSWEALRHWTQSWIAQTIIRSVLWQCLPAQTQATWFGKAGLRSLPSFVVDPVTDVEDRLRGNRTRTYRALAKHHESDENEFSGLHVWLSNALHFRRGIDNLRVRSFEVQIPIPGQLHHPHQPDWTICNRAVWDAITLIYAWSDIAPVRVALEMRIIGSSEITLSPHSGNRHGTCAIEVISTENASYADWIAFVQQLLDQWTAYRDPHTGAYLNVRPHWCKEWQNLLMHGVPILDYLKKVSYVDALPLFRTQLAQIVQLADETEEGTWNQMLIDGESNTATNLTVPALQNQRALLERVQSVFSNPLFDELIF